MPETNLDSKAREEVLHTLHTESQRRINLIWECTQAVIAISVTVATILTAMKGLDAKALDNAFVMILAMYFVRTNHIKTGGIGGSHR